MLHTLRLLTRERTRTILMLSVPAALNSLLDMVNVLVDLLMVGQLTPDATVAVGVGMQFLMLVFAFISAFMIGTNALVSRLVGAGEWAQAGVALGSILLAASLFSLPLAWLGLSLCGAFYGWMGVSPQAQILGESYLGVLLLGLPLLFVRSVMVIALSASGNTKTPFVIKIAGSLLNAALNYLFIFGHFGAPALGVEGAALSTVGVYVLETLLLAWVLRRPGARLRFGGGLAWSMVRRALKVGIPSAFERMLTFSAMVFLSKIIAGYGTAALAGYQVGLRIEGIAFMPGVGFMIAGMALAGQNLGAKNPDEAHDSVLATAWIAALIMGSLGVGMLLWPHLLAAPFSIDAQTIKSAALYLQIIGISQVPLAFLFVLDGGLRGAGATRTTLLINTISLWGLRIIPALALSHYGAPLGWIFALMACETLLRAVILYGVFERGAWRRVEV